MTSEYISMPPDVTREEVLFIDLVKAQMLAKLNDRRRFIFLYVIELGHTKKQAADVLGVNASVIGFHMNKIREILQMYRKSYD